MYNINDVSDYVILKLKLEDNHSLINLKLQKLLYYIQAWSYGMYEKPFFNGDFQAWIHGPVNIDIYNRFNSTKYLYSEIEIEDVSDNTVFDKFDKNDSEFIDYILENYAQFSGAQLENISHNEQPWIETRRHLKSNERCTKIISPDLLISYYGKKWEEINK